MKGFIKIQNKMLADIYTEPNWSTMEVFHRIHYIQCYCKRNYDHFILFTRFWAISLYGNKTFNNLIQKVSLNIRW